MRSSNSASTFRHCGRVVAHSEVTIASRQPLGPRMDVLSSERKDSTCASDRLRSCSAYSLRSMLSPLLGAAIAIALPSALTARGLLAMAAAGAARLLRTTSSVSILARLMGISTVAAPDT
jgi:hypothetical protein